VNEAILLDPQTSDDLVAEPNPSAIRRLGLVAIYYAYRVVAALVIAVPAAVVAGRVVGGFSNGDAALFEPGGMIVAEAVRLARRAVAPVLAGAGVVIVITAAVGLVPLAMLIAGLSTRGRLRASWLAARSIKAFGTLALLWGIASVAEAIVVAMLAAIATKTVDSFGWVPPRLDVARVIAIAIAAVVGLALGVVHDLARVAIVTQDLKLVAGLKLGWRALARAPMAALGGYAWRALVGFALVAFASWIAPPLAPIGSPPAGIALLVHQAAIFAALFARASWLALGVRLVDRASESDLAFLERAAKANGPPAGKEPPARDIDRTMPSPGVEPPELTK